jgi:hypothetical protein
MEEHEYSGTYTRDDYLLACRVEVESVSEVWVTRVLGVVVLLWGVYAAVVDPRSFPPWFMILVGPVILFAPYTYLPLVWRRLWGKTEALHYPVKIVLAEDSISFTTHTHEDIMQWLDHYHVSSRTIVLFTAPDSFVMLPRRFARTDSDYQYIQEFLKGFPVGKEALGKLRPPGL